MWIRGGESSWFSEFCSRVGERRERCLDERRGIARSKDEADRPREEGAEGSQRASDEAWAPLLRSGGRRGRGLGGRPRSLGPHVLEGSGGAKEAKCAEIRVARGIREGAWQEPDNDTCSREEAGEHISRASALGCSISPLTAERQASADLERDTGVSLRRRPHPLFGSASLGAACSSLFGVQRSERCRGRPLSP